LFDVWKKIAIEKPESIIPLIIVGGYGWLVEKLFERYENDPILQKYIIFTGKVENEERDAILQNARFSLFPSFAEGWGMPITESLQVGTPVISADNSSLPEAGHGITKTINVGNFGQWYETVLEYMQNDDIIEQERQKIARTKLRTWDDFNREITDIVYSNIR
jgi:glycosyltransferase involved in cell wall biosynthesis